MKDLRRSNGCILMRNYWTKARRHNTTRTYGRRYVGMPRCCLRCNPVNSRRLETRLLRKRARREGKRWIEQEREMAA